MRDVAEEVVMFSIIIIPLYIFSAFVSQVWDVTAWSVYGRGALVVVSFVIWLFSLIRHQK